MSHEPRLDRGSPTRGLSVDLHRVRARARQSVSDYSENFIQAVRPYFADAVDYRTPGPKNATLADVRRHRKAVRDLVAEGPRGRTLVHAELSTAAMAPFWSLAGLKDVLVTATVHDPPQGLWYFAGTKFVMRHRLLRGAIHVPLLPLSRAIEGAVYRDKTLFALTEAGRRSIERTFPRTRALYVPHMAFDRPSIRPAQDRPKAVGLLRLRLSRKRVRTGRADPRVAAGRHRDPDSRPGNAGIARG